MRSASLAVTLVLVGALLTGCMSKAAIRKGEADAKKPINCATAEADIRMLESEKAHGAQQITAGVTSIVPIGFVLNAVQGKELDSIKVGIGEYNRMLDKKIAEIKRVCKIK